MEGVIAACVAFIFVSVIFPQVIRNRPQFYASLVIIVLSLLLQGLAITLGSATFARVITGLTTIGVAATVLLLFLSSGGITWGGLASEMKGAIEVIRRGSTEKEIILPENRRAAQAAEMKRDVEQYIASSTQTSAGPTLPKPPTPPTSPPGPIPLE
jgi:hypothetical protein